MSETRPLRYIVTHPDHLDDHVAARILKKEWRRLGFHLVDGMEPEILFMTEKQSREFQLENYGVVIVGQTDVEFNDHGDKAGTSATQLIFDAIGGAEAIPELAEIIDEVTRLDTQPGTSPLSFAEIIKSLNRSGVDPYKMSDFVGMILGALVSAKRGFAEDYQPRYRREVGESNEWSSDYESGDNTIPLHFFVVCPDNLDDLATLWLLMKEGSRRGFRLVDCQRPEICFMNPSDAKAFAADFRGVVPIGMGGGQFDNNSAGTDMSAVKLAAEYLGIAKLPEFRRLVELITRCNALPESDLFHLDNVVASLCQANMDPFLVFELVRESLDALYTDAMEFNYGCPKEFKRTGRVEEIDGLRAAFVTSDLESMHKWIRARRQANLIVVRRYSGHVSIFSDGSSRAGRVLENILSRLQEVELLQRHVQDKHRSKLNEELMLLIAARNGGYIPGARCWYFLQAEGEVKMILNGSSSHPDIEPTELSNDAVYRAVRLSVKFSAVQTSQPKAASAAE